jgi:RHS repeat-associated protein
VLTNPQGQVVERHDYDPFGKPLTPPQHDGTLWQGQRLDHDSGLVYMNARYYDPELGRFASPDSIVPDPYRPQSLDRYAYAENDWANYTDPSGHMKMQVELKKEQAAQSTFGAMYAGALTAGCGPFQQLCVTNAPGLFVKEIYGAWTGNRSPRDIEYWLNGEQIAEEKWALPSTKSELPETVTVHTKVAGETAAAQPLFEQIGSVVERAKSVGNLLLDLVYPERHLLRGVAIGGAGNTCVMLCLGALELDGGVVMTPVGPNDYFFGEIKRFRTLGGSFTGFTLGPSAPPLDAVGGPMDTGLPVSIYPSLGLSFSGGVSLVGFWSNEVRTLPDFLEWGRQRSASIGPVVGAITTNTSGQRIYSVGVGVSVGNPVGASVYNTYTWTIPWWSVPVP